jgi:hypothetical protein
MQQPELSGLAVGLMMRLKIYKMAISVESTVLDSREVVQFDSRNFASMIAQEDSVLAQAAL